MFGYRKDQPPHDAQGFTEFVASMEVNDVYEVCSISGLIARLYSQGRDNVKLDGIIHCELPACDRARKCLECMSAS